jgi:hypothetical protein
MGRALVDVTSVVSALRAPMRSGVGTQLLRTTEGGSTDLSSGLSWCLAAIGVAWRLESTVAMPGDADLDVTWDTDDSRLTLFSEDEGIPVFIAGDGGFVHDTVQERLDDFEDEDTDTFRQLEPCED